MPHINFTVSSEPTNQLFTLVPRDAAGVLKPNATQRLTLIIAAVYIVIIALPPYLNKAIYPFKLLVVGMHESSHAIAGILTCATVESIQLDPDEGGATRMRGGVPAITLPAGYLGSSFMGAALIACGFDINASKVQADFLKAKSLSAQTLIPCILSSATCCLAFGFVLTLWWARKSWIAYVTIAFFAALLVISWLVADSVPLRFLVLFIGVMSCFYAMWDIIDDTIARKLNSSDASEYAEMIGFFGPRVWGVIWLFNSALFFVAGILVGLAAFKRDWEEQKEAAQNFMGGTP